MTISTETAKTTVVGNGVQTLWNYAFEIPAQSQASLYITTLAGVTSLVPSASWTMTGAGSPTGGTFTYPLGGGTPIATGIKLTLLRGVPAQQTTNLINQGSYYPEAVENGMDSTMMVIQQLRERANRAIVGDVTEASIGPALPPAAQRANKQLGFDSLGAPMLYNLMSSFSDLIISTGSITPRSVQDRFAEVRDVLDFGAVADGITDCTAAIAAAVTALSATGGIVWFGVGNFNFTAVTVSVRNVTLLGAGRGFYGTTAGTNLWYTGSGTGDWITVTNVGLDGFQMHDMQVRKHASVTLTAGTALKLVNSGAGRGAHVVVNNVKIDDPYNGIDLWVVDVLLADIYVEQFTGAFGLRLYGDATYVTNTVAAYRVTCVGTASANGDGILLEGNVASSWFHQCYCRTVSYGVRSIAVGASRPGLIYFNQQACEQTANDGFRLTDYGSMYFDWCWSGSCGVTASYGGAGSAYYLGTGGDLGTVRFSNCQAGSAGDHGWNVLASTSRVMLLNCAAGGCSVNTSNTSNGVNVATNVDGIQIKGGVFGGNGSMDITVTRQKWGIAIGVGCTNFSVEGADCRGNVTAGMVDNSSADDGSVITNVRGGLTSQASGTATGVTPNGTGNVNIAHGLPRVPKHATVSILGDTGVNAVQVQSLGGTNVVARVYNSATGADVVAGTFDLLWSARTIRAPN